MSRGPPNELSAVANKLMADTPELSAMWRSLERKGSQEDNLWVWAFLRSAAAANNLPPYHYVSAEGRRKLSKSIVDLASNLAGLLEDNELDAHLVYINGRIFNGYYTYEDFGESNRAQMDAAGDPKLKFSKLLAGIAKRSKEKIANEPIAGKAGRPFTALPRHWAEPKAGIESDRTLPFRSPQRNS